jgi:Spy/CpxP family protein refolding chaperone
MSSKLSKKIGTGVMVILVMACFIPVNAGAFAPGDGRHGKGIDRQGHHRSALGIWRNPQMIEKLGLTAEQVKKVREADFASREKQLPLKSQLESLRLQMERAFGDDVVDNASVLSLAEKISDVKGKLFVQSIETRLAIGEILNADQIEKLKQYAQHQKKRGYERGKNRCAKQEIERPSDISDETNE